jgi:hypothetical protein
MVFWRTEEATDMTRKWLRLGFYVLAISLLLLTLDSCAYVPAPSVPYGTEEALRTAEAAATSEIATAIVEVETYEARRTAEAPPTAATPEAASAEPALALEDVAIQVLSCAPYERFGTPVPDEFVCSYDVTFSLEYVTAGHSGYLVCFVADGGESDTNPVSEGSGASEVMVSIEDIIVRGGGETKHAAFCQLRDAGSDEWLAEAFHGESAHDDSLAMPVR